MSRAKKSSPPAAAHRTLLYGLATLGALASGWAIFLWHQLLVSRSGSTPFCGFGESGDCAALWDAEFAARVHDLTGLPVAGWGLVWGVAATFLPLFAATADREAQPQWLQSCRLIGWAAVVGVVGLLGVSAMAGLFCVSCSITYVLCLGYAGGALFGLPKAGGARPWLQTGATVGAIWLALLWPGLETPKNLERSGQQALAAAQGSGQGSGSTEAPPTLEAFIVDLDPRLQQGLADSLALYREAPALPGLPGPRNLVFGASDAPVLITEFTDTLCSHCATLHGNLAYLKSILPASAFAVDARHFPLDGNCNPHLEIRGPESVRCLAAKARICLAEAGQDFEYSAALYQVQRSLTEQQVYALAEPHMDRGELARCVDAPRTLAALTSDVDFAEQFDPTGTPLVLVNGRQGNAFGPFLFAMILAQGDADHPAFGVLPEADLEALHNSHDGHNH